MITKHIQLMKLPEYGEPWYIYYFGTRGKFLINYVFGVVALALFLKVLFSLYTISENFWIVKGIYRLTDLITAPFRFYVANINIVGDSILDTAAVVIFLALLPIYLVIYKLYGVIYPQFKLGMKRRCRSVFFKTGMGWTSLYTGKIT